MRISTQNVFERGIKQIQDVTEQTTKTQLQLSTGRKVVTPADDPVASTRILELNQELEVNRQFQRNIELADSRLSLQDSVLSGITDITQRLRELAVTAGNGTLSQDDLSSIADEVDVRLNQLAGLLNSKTPSGEFIYAGFQGQTQPFQLNEAGSYEYQGDEGQRFVRIDTTVTIATTQSGRQIFEDVEAAQNTFFTIPNANNQAVPPAQISTGQVLDQDEFDAFYPKDMVVTFTSPTTYDITERTSGEPILENQPYFRNEAIVVNGLQFEITGDPVTGDSFNVESTSRQGLLRTVERFSYTLRNFAPNEPGRAALSEGLDNTLANIDNAITSIVQARGEIGARLNTMDTTQQQLIDTEVLTQETLAVLESVDYAEAVSLLSLQQFTLEAAYSSYSQITSLSLFDRL